MSGVEDFHEEQKSYLEGFFRGSELARSSQGLPTFAATLVCVSGILGANERKPVAPAGTTTVGPFTPAILTGEYLYVSGQLGRLSSGALAPTIEEQTRIVLNQIKTLVETAGLTMDHVVYVQVYLEDINRYKELNTVFAEYFTNKRVKSDRTFDSFIF